VLARILRRLAQSIAVLLGVSVIIFFIVHLVPGDPVQSMLGTDADPDAGDIIRRHLGLDQPLVVQYFIFLANAVQGDLGTSYFYHQAVLTMVLSRIGTTLVLMTFSITLAVAFAGVLGTLAALKRDTAVDQAIRGMILVGNSIPNYWLGTILILVLVLAFPIFPIGPPPYATPLETLWGLALPAFVVSLALMPATTRVLRATLIDTIGADWVLLARSKGLTEKAILLRHVFRPSLVPVITLVGVQASFAIGGQIVVEAVFGLPGVGSLMIQGVRSRDYPLVVGAVMVFVILVMVINLVTDIVVALMDPRARIAAEAGR
jgi:peptide/nickel transport system permease protein